MTSLVLEKQRGEGTRRFRPHAQVKDFPSRLRDGVVCCGSELELHTQSVEDPRDRYLKPCPSFSKEMLVVHFILMTWNAV